MTTEAVVAQAAGDRGPQGRSSRELGSLKPTPLAVAVVRSKGKARAEDRRHRMGSVSYSFEKGPRNSSDLIGYQGEAGSD
jgi:hypothetical protein